MKVLLVASKGDFKEDMSKVTGIGRYSREVYNGLSNAGINVTILPLYDYSSLPSSILTTVKGIFHNYSGYDIIHILSPKPLIPIRKGKAKLITTVHDLFFLKYKESEPMPLMKRFYVKSILSSDTIITVSSLVKEDVERLGYKKKVFVVSPGIDERFFNKPIVKKRRRDIVKLGYIGMIDSERKNVVRGIRAFKKLKEKNVVFELWGSYNPNSEIFKEILKEAKEDPRIRIMGPTPEDRLVETYDAFDYFLFPTKEEGFGFPIVEANARGVPIIVFEDARIPEEVCKYCIRLKEDDFSIPDKNFDEEKLKKFARNFSWRNSLENLLKVYNEITK
ncbi:glycosyltransferase [Sulfurisphaera ohwakuensis]|uniref:Glycosyltransferase n=1 Tax=Sulfurisphaera ohwakuensis TaxID=69656 RepID=A0A650CIN5_SULOH|nr:glycosyltransferase [Sulfurisphaera ohwakuensis]MBB5254991.1 glycosyltransferase involved in cell wall biosynthesis [Sulfurisphaera ohwakuensis]QGR17639.1 glycosyltransferase [Sulfurisphaera ohwakuensis]